MTNPTISAAVRYRLCGLLLIVLVVVLGVLSAAAYNHAFTKSITVRLEASRAGLQMHPGNRVKAHGVDLGLVRAVSLNPDHQGVTITMDLDPTVAADVPSNVRVSLAQLTAFGNKTVQMDYPANPSSQPLHSGSVITADHVTVEVNSVFQQLTTLLSEVQPAKLNATLGAFAQGLQGHGQSLGVALTTADHYLGKLNGNLPQLRNDWRAGAGFANVYADVSPDLLRLLGNATVTSRTVADRDVDLGGALDSVGRFGHEFDGFSRQNAHPLADMVSSLTPFTSLLRQYSPEFKCLIQGGAKVHDQMLNSGFVNNGAIKFEVGFVPGGGTYKYPSDLPKVGPGSIPGPNCRGLPNVPPNGVPHLDDDPFGVKGGSNNPQVSPEPALVQFFGPQALMPGLSKGGK